MTKCHKPNFNGCVPPFGCMIIYWSYIPLLSDICGAWLFTGVHTPAGNFLCKAPSSPAWRRISALGSPRKGDSNPCASVPLLLSVLCDVRFTWRLRFISPLQSPLISPRVACWHMTVPGNEVAWIFSSGWITGKSQFYFYKCKPFSNIRQEFSEAGYSWYNLPRVPNRMIQSKTQPSYLPRTFY